MTRRHSADREITRLLPRPLQVLILLLILAFVAAPVLYMLFASVS